MLYWDGDRMNDLLNRNNMMMGLDWDWDRLGERCSDGHLNDGLGGASPLGTGTGHFVNGSV